MEDPRVICPFNKSHKIMISKLQGHILKCMKSNCKTGPTICPFNNQHIIDAPQILKHCIICPNIKDVLIQANICGNKNDSSNNDVSPTPTFACNSTVNVENDNTAHSNSKMEREKTFYQKSLRRPKNEKSETLIKVPNVRGVKKTEKRKNHSQDVLKKKIISQEHHTVTSDAGSINTHGCDQFKLLTKTTNDYGEIYRKLKVLEEKEIDIAKRMQFLRQKEKEIGEEKKELIETLKNIVFYTNTTNNNYHNNQKREGIVACKDDKVDTNTEKNIHEQDGNISNSKFEEKLNNLQYIRPLMPSLTSPPLTPESSPNTNKMRSFGRGIMRAYNQKKILPNKKDQS